MRNSRESDTLASPWLTPPNPAAPWHRRLRTGGRGDPAALAEKPGKSPRSARVILWDLGPWSPPVG
jgi:hypothetical protein